MKTIESVTVAATLHDDKIAIMEFITYQGPVGPDPGWTREASAEEIEKELVKSGIHAKSWRLIDRADLPDRAFRNAWRDVDGAIKHDMTIARELHLSHLRLEREKRFEKLDKDWMRAFGQGKTEEAASIEAARQALRDFPESIEPLLQQATTIAELQNIIL